MSQRPNILVIMTDQQKATASHLYGNPDCVTPSLERLAKSGVLYEHAVTPHPLCMPARVSFWTGQWPHSHGSRRNETPMRPNSDHAARLWQDAGYHVGLIGKNHCFADPADLSCFDTWCEISHGGLGQDAKPRGMEWYRPREGVDAAHALRHTMTPRNSRFSYGVNDYPLEDYGTGLIVGQTVRFLEAHQEDPFALWVSIPDPHEPWVAPQVYADMFPPESIHIPPWREDEFTDGTSPERNRILYEMMGVRRDSPDDLRGLMSVYYGMIRFIDDGVGQILDALESLHLRNRTIVVFCSDHGDLMGEHAMQCKGGVFYDALTRVPLIISWPGEVPSGVRDAGMANLVDVVPTLLTLQGLPVPAGMHGRPLSTVTSASPRDATFSEYGAGGEAFGWHDLMQLPQPHGRITLIDSLQWREAEGRRKMVRTANWKYVHDPMGDLDELYDLSDDPWELTNVAADPRYADRLHELRLRLADWAVQVEDAVPVPLPPARARSQL